MSAYSGVANLVEGTKAVPEGYIPLSALSKALDEGIIKVKDIQNVQVSDPSGLSGEEVAVLLELQFGLDFGFHGFFERGEQVYDPIRRDMVRRPKKTDSLKQGGWLFFGRRNKEHGKTEVSSQMLEEARALIAKRKKDLGLQ